MEEADPRRERQSISALDVVALASLVLEQSARSAAQDLQEMVRQVEAIHGKKSALRELLERVAAESEELARALRCEYEELFVATEADELALAKLQTAMDRRSKLLETLSNILKKLADSDSAIAQNLK